MMVASSSAGGSAPQHMVWGRLEEVEEMKHGGWEEDNLLPRGCTFRDGQIFNSLNGVIEFTEASRALMKISGRSGSCMIMK